MQRSTATHIVVVDLRLSKKSSLCWAFSIIYAIIIMGDEKCLNEGKWSVEFMKL